MATFNFASLEQFAGSSTSIKRPREFTYFSYDDEHILHPLSTQSLSYYYPPLFNAPGTHEPLIDLSAGFDSFLQRSDSPDEHLDGLLDTLQAHEEKLLARSQQGENDVKLEDVISKADVVTWRGMMTKILTAPFDEFNEFEMNATYFQGTIFIEENHADKLIKQNMQNARPSRPGQASQELMQYWGYKFETLAVLPKPWGEVSRDEIRARETKIVNNHAQYCSIARTSIGPTSLIIAGEVDCVAGEKPDSPDDPIPWVELKTTAEMPSNHPRELLKFERKLLRFWAQSFLLGVPTIAVGYRTQDGRLTRIQELQTQRIPSLVKQSTHAWDGNICINFTAAFLEFLKRTIGEQQGVWRLRKYKGDKKIEVFRVEETGTGDILKPSFKAHREKLVQIVQPPQ